LNDIYSDFFIRYYLQNRTVNPANICYLIYIHFLLFILFYLLYLFISLHFLFIYLSTRYQFISRKFIEANTNISFDELNRRLIYALASPLINHGIHWWRESRPIFNPHQWLRLIQMTRGIIWSTCVGVAKGLRVRRGQRALSRLLDRQEASFSRAHADKKKQRECGSAVDTQVRPVPANLSWRVRHILLSGRSKIKKQKANKTHIDFFSIPEGHRRINICMKVGILIRII